MKNSSTTLLALLLYGIAYSQGCIPVRNLVGFGQFINPRYDSLNGESTKWIVNVNSRFYESYQTFNGSDKVNQNSNDLNVNHVFIMNFSVSRMFENGWSYSIDVPISSSSRTTRLEHDSSSNNRYTTRSFGLGDIRVTAYKWLFDDSDGVPIKIALSSPAAGTGTVSVRFFYPDDFGAIYGRDFVTIPQAYGNTMTLPVAFHDESVSFTVFPIDNSICGYRSATMVIMGSSGAIVTDDGSASSLTIIDDDLTILTFEQANASVVESNTSGIDVHLNFSKPAKENAILLIAGPAYAEPHYLYGTVYVTNPPMNWDWYDLYAQVPVQKGETGASFTILPINNNIDNPEPILLFRMAYGSDVCFNSDGYYTLTIEDDD